MSSHIHDLWDELDLPEEYPQVDPQAVLARVNAALDGDEPPKEKPMKRSLRWGLILAAVLVLLSGTVAAAYRSGVLSLFFQGDTSQLEPYVQEALDTAENEDYRLRVDSCLYDGQNVYAVVTVEALNDQATQDLMSNRVIAESHRETWGEEMVEGLMKSGSTGPETFHCNQLDFSPSSGGIGISDLPDPNDHSRSWRIEVQFSSYVGPQEQPLEFWVGFMGRDCAVDIPLDNMAQPIHLTLSEEVVYNPFTGYKGILKEFILTPTSYSITVEPQEKPDSFYHRSWADQAEDCFFLRMKDGTILSRTQLGGISGQFDTAVDLSQVESIIYGYTEFPVDGSPSFPAGLPENFYPFSCTEIISEGEYSYFRFPVEELCQKLGVDYQWDEATQTATATYRDVTLTMTVGQASYQRNGESVELILKVHSDPLDLNSDYEAYPQYISIEDGVLTAPVVLLEDWSLDYPPLRDVQGKLSGQMLVMP